MQEIDKNKARMGFISSVGPVAQLWPSPAQQLHVIVIRPERTAVAPIVIVIVDCFLPTAAAASPATGGRRPTTSPRMPQVQGSRAPPWSDLPPELLSMVFLHLSTRADRASFHSVCRMWFSAAHLCRPPPPSPVPWILLPDGSATSFPHGETFQLPDDTHYHKSCGEWLLLSRNDGSYFLMNHFTKATMPLPRLYSRSFYEVPMEVIEDYMVQHYYEWQGPRFYSSVICEIYVVSLVVCSTRLIAAIIAASSFRTISLCRPGAGAWSVCAKVECGQLSDMVFLHGKIYALDRTTGTVDLIVIDIVDEYDNEPRVSRIKRLIEGIPFPCQEWMPYLLESHGKLLMIYRKVSNKTERGPGIPATGSSEFVVFNADLDRRLWAEMRTLGNDQALFLGRGCSRAVQVSPNDLSRDCIFYLHDSINWSGNLKKAVRSCELYDMKDGKIYSALPPVPWESRKVPANWLFSHGETDKAANSTSQEIVEPEVEPLMLISGGICSADASPTPH